MKFVLLTLSGMLILCLSLTAQNFSNQSLQKSLKLYTQLKTKAIQQIEHDNLKDNGSIPEIQYLDRYYSTNNRKDSTLYLSRNNFGPSQLSLDAKDIYIYTITSLFENDQSEPSFLSYPNPAKHELDVEFPKDRFEVLLYDLNGVEKFRSMEKGNFKIDVSQFSKGIYFLRIDNSVKKIIIQ